jgi:hypothetical protein
MTGSDTPTWIQRGVEYGLVSLLLLMKKKTHAQLGPKRPPKMVEKQSFPRKGTDAKGSVVFLMDMYRTVFSSSSSSTKVTGLLKDTSDDDTLAWMPAMGNYVLAWTPSSSSTSS